MGGRDVENRWKGVFGAGGDMLALGFEGITTIFDLNLIDSA